MQSNYRYRYRKQQHKVCFIVLISAILFCPRLYGQTSRALLGYSGMIVVPSATLARDATAVVGFARIPSIYGVKLFPAQKSIYFAALTFTPFLEATFAMVKPDRLSDRPLHVGDRTASIKLRLLPDTGRIPAVAIGAHDFFNLKQLGLAKPGRKLPENFAALYAVASKSFKPPYVYRLVAHAGYGTDWLPAVQNYLVGPFGGMELFVSKALVLMIESDAKHVNFGGRCNLFSHLQFYLSWMNRTEACGGVNFSFNFKEF
jgi:hypothetical protein